jgi:replicative DNA helicase
MNSLEITAMLPWSQAAEQALIGAILMDCTVGFECAQPLEPRQFFDPRHADIYSCIERMVANRSPVDVVTVGQALSDEGKGEQVGGLQYLNQLAQSTPSARSAGRYSKIVRDKALGRAFLETADKALELASESGDDTNARIDQVSALFGALQRQQMPKLPKSLAEVAVQRTAHYDALQQGTVIAGWSTDIPRLDSLLNGGWQPGRLYILAARPAVGKSSLGQFLGLGQAKAGRKVLFLSQEMSCEELADRAVSSAGRISYSALLSGNMADSDWQRAAGVLESPDLKDFYVDDQGGLTLLDIRAKARQVPGLSMLIVDYLQLCSGSVGKDANRNAEIEQISRGLKTLAKELGIVVVALSQLNRGVETRTNKRPMLSDLRDSGAIEQDADVVMFLWPVREFPGGAKLIGLGLDKNRQGRCGDVALHFDGSVQRWAESTESLAPAKPLPAARRGMDDDY